MMKLISAAAVLAIAAGASAATVYSTGFESPFVAGGLNGQQGWIADAGTVVNNAANARSGNQYARMVNSNFSTTVTANWAWNGTTAFTPGVGNAIVTMTVYAGIFNYTGTRTYTAGLDAYDASVARIGAVYLGTDGSFGVIDGIGGGGNSAGGLLALNAYHKLQMVANYSTGVINFLVDDVNVFTGAFTNTDFSDADIRGTRATTGTAATSSMELRFDDYSITTEAIPAPGALALLGLGGLVAGRRRRA